MTFQNPSLLAGIAASGVPCVIHLLNRARYRNVPWGAMIFLDGMNPRADRSARMGQWALLAGRCALLGALAFALARPVLNVYGIAPQQPGRSAAVIVLDRSASMALSDNGRPRIDLARDVIYQLLSPGFHKGDDLWLVTLGDGDASPIYSSDPQAMAQFVRQVPGPSGVADIPAGLNQALALLAQSTAPNHEIDVICDRQANSWANADADFARQWSRSVSASTPHPRVLVATVGSDQTDNVSLLSIHPSDEPVVTGQPTQIWVTIRNHGVIPRASLTLELSLRTPAGRKIAVGRTPFSIPALGSVSKAFTVTFQDAGCHLFTAALEAPGMVTDRQISASFDVIKSPRVLIIDGDEREGEFQSSSDFLSIALAPYHDTKRDPFQVDILHPQMWASTDLSPYQVLILTNLPTWSEAQAKLVERFAYDGGGVIVVPGDQARVDSYNTLGFLPATLTAPIPPGDSAVSQIGSIDGVLLKPAVNHQEMAASVGVRRYFPSTPRADSTVMGRYSDGKPFLIERPCGPGRIVLMTTPVDPDWNALPFTPLFLPLSQSLVNRAASSLGQNRQQQWNVMIGQPLVMDVAGNLDPKMLRLEGPNGSDARSLVTSSTESSTQIRLLAAQTPGVYRISTRGGAVDPQAVYFSVRTPVEESDLTPLTSARRTELATMLNADWIDPDRLLPASAQETQRAGRSLWLPMICAVILVMLLELFLTADRSRRRA